MGTIMDLSLGPIFQITHLIVGSSISFCSIKSFSELLYHMAIILVMLSCESLVFSYTISKFSWHTNF